MIEAIFKALAGKEDREIGPIPEDVLSQLRQLQFEKFLVEVNIKGAVSKYIFDSAQEMGPEIFFSQKPETLNKLKIDFKNTKRGIALRYEFERLSAEIVKCMKDYLHQNGYGNRKDISFNLEKGVLIEEISI